MSITYSIVFPGQGSQSLGMLHTLSKEYPMVKQTFEEASEILNYDLWNLAQKGPVEQLNLTLHTQPILLAADVAVWRVLDSQIKCAPAFMAGHSLGEYAALVCGESISFADGIFLVQKRAQLMQEAVPEGQGGMGAIVGLSEIIVEQICKEVQEIGIASPANFNSLGQIVIAGELEAVKKALLLAKEHQAKIATLLPMSVPSHCILMKKASVLFAEFIQHIPMQSPLFPIIHNYDVKTHTHPDTIKDVLVQQLCFPVRWVETIQFMIEKGVQHIYEVGPNKVLTGLNKRISTDITCLPFYESEHFKNFKEIQNALC